MPYLTVLSGIANNKIFSEMRTQLLTQKTKSNTQVRRTPMKPNKMTEQ
jgi:hypothetical protein